MAYYGPPGNYRSSLVGEANHGPPPNNNNNVRPANAEATQILPYLFLGSSESASNRSLLQAFRVTHVLNMAKELPNYFDSCPDMNISYMRGDFSDFAFEDLLSFFPRGIQFISRAHDYAGGSGVVLVHCQAGKSRSASMVIAYLMYRYAYKLEDALAIVKTQRPIVDVFNFTHQLREFEQALERSDHYIMALECTANGLPFHPKPIEQITKQIPIRHSGSEQHSEAPSRIFLLNHTPDVPSSRFQPQPLSSAELNFANGPPPPPSYPRPPPGPPPAHALRVAIPTLLATSPRNNNNNSNPYLVEEKRDAYNTAAPPDAFARKWAQMSAPVAPVSSSFNGNSAVALNAELPPLMARRLNKNKDAGVARIASLQLNPEFYSPSSSPPSSYTAAAIASPQPFSAPHVPDQLRAAQEAPVNNCCTIQ